MTGDALGFWIVAMPAFGLALIVGDLALQLVDRVWPGTTEKVARWVFR